MKRLNVRRIITLSLCLALLISLGTKFVFADESLTGFDNFKKVQTYKEGIFTDVKEIDWFHDSIKNLYELKLMIGMSESLFDTENNLKVSEAMALAVRLNATYNGEALPEQGQGKKWFEPYVTYIREKEIASPDDYDLNSPITRRQFAEIFSRALPSDAYKEINDVKEGMIPDVTGDMELNKAIFTLFRSGVLTGMDETRSFEPDRTIKRSEAATIVSRIVNPKERVDLGLPIVEDPVVPVLPEKEDKKSSGGGGGSSSGGGGGSNPPAKDYSKEPLTFTALSEGSTFIKFCEMGTINDGVSYEFKLESGDWDDYEMGSPIEVVKGKTVSFRVKEKVEEISYNYQRHRYFYIDNDNDSTNTNSAQVEVSGNIMSLLDPDMNLKDLSSKDGDGNYKYTNVFMNLFKSCSAITDASHLSLSATTLADSCYFAMFSKCTNLVNAPELPATTLADYCYSDMFNECTSLVTAPSLPATTLADYCYFDMFYGCTSLENAPQLPATTLADYCYDEMFGECTSLVNAPELLATELADYCYYWMFYGCTSLENAPQLPATTLVECCYNNMFRECTSLVNAPQLPATTLVESCYNNMFRECTSLVNAPQLPATTLADYCYYWMFYGCTSLENAPQLPATELARSCYSGMFNNCTNLKSLDVSFSLFDESSPKTSNWLEGVEGPIIVICPSELKNSDYTPSINTFPLGTKFAPDKGDVITLDNDNSKLYKVLNRDSLKVQLITMESFDKAFANDWDEVEANCDDEEDFLYKDSRVDKFLNEEYYDSLSQNIKDAIVKKNVKQYSADYFETDPGEYDAYETYNGLISLWFKILDIKEVGERNVFALGLDDLVKAFDSKDFSSPDIISWLGMVDVTRSPISTMYIRTVGAFKAFPLALGYYNNLITKQTVRPSFIVDLTKVDYDFYDDYFAIIATTNSFVSLHKEGTPTVEWNLEYKIDNGTWEALPVDDTPVELDSGQTMHIRNQSTLTTFHNNNLSDDDPYYTFNIDDSDPSDGTNNARVNLSGNIMSLLSPTFDVVDFKNENGIFTDVFCGLFKDNDAIVEAKDLLLPSKRLSEGCYANMFNSCKNLISAPDLPADELAENCYAYMFKGCTSLENAPDLPATKLAGYCYSCMFSKCTNLVDAPDLLSEELAEGCYECMFDGCTNLENVQQELPATTLAVWCYEDMFKGCTKLKNAPDLPATELVDGCYSCMFGGCTNLQTLNVSFTEFKYDNDETYEWLGESAFGRGDTPNPSNLIITCPTELANSPYTPGGSTFPAGCKVNGTVVPAS